MKFKNKDWHLDKFTVAVRVGLALLKGFDEAAINSNLKSWGKSLFSGVQQFQKIAVEKIFMKRK